MIPGAEPIELIAYYPQFIDYYPHCELEVKKWFVDNVKKEWVLFDCGANIGYYTILFSRLAPNGHIYAFEPTVTRDMLLKNIHYHSITNVTIIHKALGNKTGAYNDSIFRIWGTNPEIKEYDFITIDEYVTANNIQKIDCIKIDVDSFDLEVLKGAQNTLAKFDPYVMVELNHALCKRGQSREEALKWIASIGYPIPEIYDLENFLLKKENKC